MSRRLHGVPERHPLRLTPLLEGRARGRLTTCQRAPTVGRSPNTSVCPDCSAFAMTTLARRGRACSVATKGRAAERSTLDVRWERRVRAACALRKLESTLATLAYSASLRRSSPGRAVRSTFATVALQRPTRAPMRRVVQRLLPTGGVDSAMDSTRRFFSMGTA